MESVAETTSQFPIPDSPNIRCNDLVGVVKKVEQLIAEGKDNLQLITDFDRTLTKSNCKSSFEILEHHPNFPERIRKETKILVDKYHPIEIDPRLTVQEKIPYMVQWWAESKEKYNGLELDYPNLEACLKSLDIHFREDCDSLFKKLHEGNVPTLIFSAGIGDVIECAIKLHSFNTPNVHIVSNFLKFDGNIVSGFKGSVIHVFNKNEHAIEGTSYFKDVKERKNIILMGDSLGDADMAEGVENAGVVLKIAFLSSKEVSLHLPQYLAKYDIVLLEDETMHIPLRILDKILNHNPS